MKKNHLIITILFCFGLSVSAQNLPYQNPQLSAKERAKDLCSRLTLEEKAMLMLDESPAISRLGIKKFFWWSEALHGAANMGNVTVFPEPIAMASSFNPDLLYKVFDAASTEFRAQYNERMYRGSGEDEKFHSLSVWTPNVNIFRDPRWGRGQETYGEDPYLTSVMGTQVVKGLQGPSDTKYRKLYACAKHYAIHSGPEYSRHSDNIIGVSPRDLWETYMPAFKACVQKGDVREVMCAYQRWDDEPCCGSQRLLQKILRDDWGFKYMVVSDCGAVSDFWTQRNYHTPDDTHATEDLVAVYSAHPYGTMDTGYFNRLTLAQYAEQAPRIAEMGFDAVWLLPVFKHTGDNVYEPIDQGEIDSRYGGITEAKTFLDAAHASGMKVLFDFVPHGPSDSFASAKTCRLLW